MMRCDLGRIAGTPPRGGRCGGDRGRFDDRRRRVRGVVPGCGSSGNRADHRLGNRRSGGVLQCGVVGAACCCSSGVRRHLCLRSPTARRVLGASRRVGVRRRQDSVVCGDGADGRRVPVARTGPYGRCCGGRWDHHGQHRWSVAHRRGHPGAARRVGVGARRRRCRRVVEQRRGSRSNRPDRRRRVRRVAVGWFPVLRVCRLCPYRDAR